jgi:uncharacterized membrane protein
LDIKTKKDLKDNFMTTSRIETLVDGIFAISMTLLVLNLDVPQLVSPTTNLIIIDYLISLIPKFYVYALSFILLAVFWRINHQAFHRIKRSNNIFSWINVMWLMFVALVPFSTSLMGEYGEFQAATLFFHLNMLCIGILSLISWRYAFKNDLTTVKLTEKSYRNSIKMYMMFPIVCLVAIALTFISPSWSSLAYMGMFLFKKIKD